MIKKLLFLCMLFTMFLGSELLLATPKKQKNIGVELNKLYGKNIAEIAEVFKLKMEFEFIDDGNHYEGFEGYSNKDGYFLVLFKEKKLFAISKNSSAYIEYFSNLIIEKGNELPFEKGFHEFISLLEQKKITSIPEKQTRKASLDETLTGIFLPITFVVIAIPIALVSWPIVAYNSYVEGKVNKRWQHMRLGLTVDELNEVIKGKKQIYISEGKDYEIWDLVYFSDNSVAFAGIRNEKVSWIFRSDSNIRELLE